MKRSPSYSCSSSSSSSCGGPEILDQSNLQQSDQKPINKPKRTRRNRKINPAAEKCQNTNNKPNSSGHGRRSSIYRGVTRHRWTGRYEAHLWDKSSWNNIQNKKGRQVYLGAYDGEEAAAHTYDLAALKYWGPATTLNFPIDTYTKELEEMQKVSREEYLASLRRQSSGFSRGVSKYRGVARHHHNGRWEARIGRVFGNKYLYLGTYNTQEEAAAAYDIAAIEYRGANAVTNFDISNYIDTFKRKNLPLNLQQQPEQDPPPKCSINGPAEEEVKEHKVQQCQPQPQQQQQLKEEQMVMTPQLHEYPHLVPCIESTTMDVMDLGHNDHQNQFTWNFMDTAGFTTQLPVPDMSLDNKPFDQLPDLFDDMGFEANFDLIFGAAGGDANLNGLLDTATAGCGVDEVGASRNLEDNGSSSYSSPSSTTTSVSYNYSV